MIRGLDGFKPTSANAEGRIPQLIYDAGFSYVTIKGKVRTSFGEVQFFTAIKK